MGSDASSTKFVFASLFCVQVGSALALVALLCIGMFYELIFDFCTITFHHSYLS